MSKLQGLDISFDGDAKAIKAAGRTFAIAELAIGTSENPSGGRMLRAFQAAGLLGSLYVYLIYAKTNADGERVPTDPVAQARAHLAMLAKHPPVDFAVAIDIEQPVSGKDSNLPLSPKEIVDWLDAYLDVLIPGLGYAPLVYSYPDYLRMLKPALAASRNLGKCPLWIADADGGEDPSESYLGLNFDPKARGGAFFLPPGVNPWQSWSMIQSRGNATVPGVPHIVDVDVFRGTEGDLREVGKPHFFGPLPPLPAPPNALPAPVAEPVKTIVSGKAPLYAALLAAVAAGVAWLVQHWRR